MARKKTPKLRVNVKASLSRRLREIRQEIFGEHGGPELARRLNLPARTWYNYETGVTVPAEVLLGFIEQTGANPMWLLNGEGPRYRHSNDDRLLSELTPVELIRRGLEELERSSNEMVIVAPENLPGDQASEFVAVGLYPLADIADTVLNPAQVEGSRAGVPALAAQSQRDDRDSTDRRRHASDPARRLDRGRRPLGHRSAQAPWSDRRGSPGGVPMIRWLDVSGRHVILRPNQNSGREFPLIPVEIDDATGSQLIIGQVVWSWSRFGQN